MLVELTFKIGEVKQALGITVDASGSPYVVGRTSGALDGGSNNSAAQLYVAGLTNGSEASERVAEREPEPDSRLLADRSEVRVSDRDGRLVYAVAHRALGRHDLAEEAARTLIDGLRAHTAAGTGRSARGFAHRDHDSRVRA